MLRARESSIFYDAPIDTLTFLFTDIEKSTELLRRVGGDVYSKILEHHHHLIRSSLQSNSGVEQGTQGDSFFAVFTSPSACVQAAVEVQRAFASSEWPLGEKPLVRMGIHTGEVAESATGLVGYEVHRAARIGAVCHGGQVLLSSASAGLVADMLPAGVTLRDLGSHRLKDLGRPETILQLVIEGLKDDFPPLRSLDNPELANNLPASLSPFIGRADELLEVRALVTRMRMVTLIGAGGSGKTRLALQVAAELLDGSGEGVWFVDFSPISDPELVPSIVISSLQLRQQPDCSPVDSLLKTLRDQNVLIMLDNCEHLVDAVAKLADLIGRHCPRVSLVATSREPLGVDGEQVYLVRTLSLPTEGVESVKDLEGSDAVELFVARARGRDSTFCLEDAIAPIVASICRRLDGIPLAIELAASRLSSMSLDDLHERLDQRFHLLTGGSRSALPRHQTLGAMVAWSYDLLMEPEQGVLRRLSVFVGGFDLKAAEAVCASENVQPFEVTDLLSSLVNKSLVGAERSSTSLRYRLLETIRQYAADQLIQVGTEIETLAARRCHAEYFLRLCEEVAPELIRENQGLWMKKLDSEWDNLQATFNYFSREGDGSEKILRMGVSASPFFLTRLHKIPIGFIQAALNSDAVIPTPMRARALLTLGVLISLTQAGDQPEQTAFALLSEAVEMARAINDTSLLVELWLANSSFQLGFNELMRGFAQESVEIARDIGDARLLGQALLTYGITRPTPQEGRGYQLEALANLRRAGDLQMVCTTLFYLSNSALFEGLLEETLAFQKEATEIAVELDSPFHKELLWGAIGGTLYLLGEVVEAERYSRQALFNSRRVGARSDSIYWIIFVLACCATSKEDYVRGAQLVGVHEAIERELPEPLRGFWSPLEIEMRRRNNECLAEALGVAQFERLKGIGGELTLDQMIDLGLARIQIIQ